MNYPPKQNIVPYAERLFPWKRLLLRPPYQPCQFRLQHRPPVASGIELADWGERFVAWLIDVIIVGIVVGILGLFSLIVGLALPGWPGWLPFFNFNLGGVLYFLYWMFMDGAYGQSFGKMVMRLKVTRLDGGKINMGAAAIESVGKAFLLPLDALIGWILYPKRRQRLFNYISETIVVKET